MKPPPLEYARASSVEEAVALLDCAGEDAKPIAGGQSLVPLLAFRLARPSLLVDIDRLPGLDGIRSDERGLSLGALVRHERLARSELGPQFAALREAAAVIGHQPIRVRGTLGGSLAHADPAAELCVALVALDGVVGTHSPHGRRELGAEAFFVGPFTTALEPSELVVDVRFPTPPPTARSAFEEVSERAGDFALASACVAVAPDRARVALGSVGATPMRVPRAERVLADGGDPHEAAAAAAAEADVQGDRRLSARQRRALVVAVVERAAARALA